MGPESRSSAASLRHTLRNSNEFLACQTARNCICRTMAKPHTTSGASSRSVAKVKAPQSPTLRGVSILRADDADLWPRERHVSFRATAWLLGTPRQCHQRGLLLAIFTRQRVLGTRYSVWRCGSRITAAAMISITRVDGSGTAAVALAPEPLPAVWPKCSFQMA